MLDITVRRPSGSAFPCTCSETSIAFQAKRDEAFLEDYRRQAHEALAKDPYSTSFSEDPEIIHKNPVVRSTIKYKNQSPGDGSSFSASNQVSNFKSFSLSWCCVHHTASAYNTAGFPQRLHCFPIQIYRQQTQHLHDCSSVGNLVPVLLSGAVLLTSQPLS